MRALKLHTFFTPTEANRCGLEVKRLALYYMCGHVLEENLVVTKCDFVKRAESLNLNERSFFISGYKKINCHESDKGALLDLGIDANPDGLGHDETFIDYDEMEEPLYKDTNSTIGY